MVHGKFRIADTKQGDDAAVRQGDFPVVRCAIPVRIHQTGECQPLRLEFRQRGGDGAIRISLDVEVKGPEVESVPGRAGNPEVCDDIAVAQAVVRREPEGVRAGAAS